MYSPLRILQTHRQSDKLQEACLAVSESVQTSQVNLFHLTFRAVEAMIWASSLKVLFGTLESTLASNVSLSVKLSHNLHHGKHSLPQQQGAHALQNFIIPQMMQEKLIVGHFRLRTSAS